MTNDERKPQFKFLSGIRKDGKYKVSLYFPGSPNMFGGFYHGKSFTKLYSAARCIETITTGLYETHNVPVEIKEVLEK